MILLIDIGNTNIKWACLQSGELGAISSDALADGLVKDSLYQRWVDLQRPEKIVISNVASDECSRQLDHWIWQTWQTSPCYLYSTGHAYGVVNGYNQAEMLGVDRWAALIGARHVYQLPLCVIDCGTALTIDILDGKGVHQGGLILPGLKSSVDFLATEVLGINVVDLNVTFDKELSLGRDTVEGVLQGSRYSYGAAIERVVADFNDKFNAELICIITGGDAGMLSMFMVYDHIHDPALVFKGLAVVAENIE